MVAIIFKLLHHDTRRFLKIDHKQVDATIITTPVHFSSVLPDHLPLLFDLNLRLLSGC